MTQTAAMVLIATTILAMLLITVAAVYYTREVLGGEGEHDTDDSHGERDTA